MDPIRTKYTNIISDPIARRSTEIANKVCGGPPVRCFGWKAMMWQAAWDGACVALGGDPEAYRVRLNEGK